MAVQLFIFENEQEVLNHFVTKLHDRGFHDIHGFENTDNVVQRISERYDRPSIIISDYFIDPSPPSRFLPQLKLAGFSLPAIIISGSIKLQEINAFSYGYPVLGFFDKGAGPREVVNQLAKHLVDITPDAVQSYELYSLRQLALSFAGDLTRLERKVALKLLGFEEVKNVFVNPKVHKTEEARAERISRDRAYRIYNQIFEFLGRDTDPRRYVVLHEALSS